MSSATSGTNTTNTTNSAIDSPSGGLRAGFVTGSAAPTSPTEAETLSANVAIAVAALSGTTDTTKSAKSAKSDAGAAGCICLGTLGALAILAYAGSVLALFITSVIALSNEFKTPTPGIGGCGDVKTWVIVIASITGIQLISAKKQMGATEKDYILAAVVHFLFFLGMGLGTYVEYYDKCDTPAAEKLNKIVEFYMILELAAAGLFGMVGIAACVGTKMS
jgi:hypothetical protein